MHMRCFEDKRHPFRFTRIELRTCVQYNTHTVAQNLRRVALFEIRQTRTNDVLTRVVARCKQQQLGIIRPSSLLFLRCVSKRGCAPTIRTPPKKQDPALHSHSFCVVFFMPLSYFWVYFTKLNNVWKKNGTLIGNFSLALQKTAQIGPNAKKIGWSAPGGFTLNTLQT